MADRDEADNKVEVIDEYDGHGNYVEESRRGPGYVPFSLLGMCIAVPVGIVGVRAAYSWFIHSQFSKLGILSLLLILGVLVIGCIPASIVYSIILKVQGKV